MSEIGTFLTALPSLLLAGAFALITGIHMFRKSDTTSILMFIGGLSNLLIQFSQILLTHFISKEGYSFSEIGTLYSALGVADFLAFAIFLVGLGLRLLKKE